MLRPQGNEVRQELEHQHSGLEEVLRALMRLASDVDPRPLQSAWAAFEPGLLRHLALEEETLFPLVESTHAEEVRALRAEHDRIRDVVAELGVCCDLHAVRRQAVERLARMLRMHTAREDATLYRWVEEEAPIDTRRHLLRLVADTVRAGMDAAPGA